MALEKVWMDLGLVLLLLAGTIPGEPAYGPGELLAWLQRSNFGYQVLQQSQKPSQERLCAAQVAQLLQAADAQALPALKVLDAWGKFPHGLLYGHFSDLGNYESCLETPLHMGVAPTKYCLAQVRFEALLPEPSETISLSIGMCAPAACSAAQLSRWLGAHLQLLFGKEDAPGLTPLQLVQESDCALASGQPFSALDWLAVALLITLALLVALCTMLDYVKAPLNPWAAFSLRQNLPQLLQIAKPSGSAMPHIIPCLHGIRCLTIVWIIWGHDYMFMLQAPSVNSYAALAWAQTPFSMLLQSGSVTVDTFFLLSGTLLAMSALRELERASGRLSVPLMYLHRVVRLTPVLAVAMLLFVTLFPRIDSGPLWRQYTGSWQLCADTWWATLLYVQNYAAAGRMCLGHSWYLAVDTQLFLLSPLLLWPLWRWRRRAVAAILLLILLLFGCVFCIILRHDLIVFNRRGNLGADSPEMRLIYYTTHARATPWLIGLLLGYFLHTRAKAGGRRGLRLSRWLAVLLLWPLTLLLLASVLWSLYPYTRPTAAEITPLAGAFYLCCSRIAWPLAVCLLVWACQSGRGGIANTLLSWAGWQPLSRLSYCLYICHLMVEMINTGRLKSSQHFSNYDVILHFWSDFGVTLMVSLLMYLCVEAPLVRLELQLLGSRRAHRAPTTAAPPPVTPTLSLAVIAEPSASASKQNLVEA